MSSCVAELNGKLPNPHLQRQEKKITSITEGKSQVTIRKVPTRAKLTWFFSFFGLFIPKLLKIKVLKDESRFSQIRKFFTGSLIKLEQKIKTKPFVDIFSCFPRVSIAKLQKKVFKNLNRMKIFVKKI